MLRAVIFDMDGVLLDSESRHFHIIYDMMAERGYEYTVEYFHSTCGTLEEEMWPKLLADAGLYQEDPLQMQKEHWQRYQKETEENGQPVFPGLRKFLGELKKEGYQIAVASASPTEKIRENLRELECGQYFSCIVSARECIHCKPEPDVFLLAAEKLGVLPEECMVIEDSVKGMLAAYRAGMCWIGFCGAEVAPDMSLAPFTFADYRKTGSKQLRQWYEKFPETVKDICIE